MAKNKTVLTILGKEYTILSEEDGQYVTRVGYYLNERLNELNQEYVGLSTVMVTTLAALNITDDFLKAQDSLQTARKELKKLQEALRNAQIESRLKSNTSSVEAEMKRLEERCKRLERENHELKHSGRVSTFNQNVK